MKICKSQRAGIGAWQHGILDAKFFSKNSVRKDGTENFENVIIFSGDVWIYF